MFIVRTLRDAGHTAYFAGGCVRDELLGRTPDDFDVATDATPDRIQSLFRKTAAVGAAFGVVLVKHAGHVIEVATFRSDGSYTDKRRPDAVTFSTPEEDAKRRDFTANALFLDPLTPPAEHTPGAHGTVIDLVGGLADLSARVLRAVGNPHERLAEDHLRALRAVRLSAKLGFAIDPTTAQAISQHAADLTGVSRERIGDELRAMMALDQPKPVAAIRELHRLGLDQSCLGSPSVSSSAFPQLESLAADPSFSFATAIAALALDRDPDPSQINPKAASATLRQALCLSNDESDVLLHTLNAWLRLPGWPSMTIAARKRLASFPAFAPAIAIYRARDRALSKTIQNDTSAYASDGIGLSPTQLITGDDLTRSGFRPGPLFRSVLDRVYDAQLEGRVRTFSEAMELAKSMIV